MRSLCAASSALAWLHRGDCSLHRREPSSRSKRNRGSSSSGNTPAGEPRALFRVTFTPPGGAGLTNGRILNPQLFQIIVVLRRIVIERLHARTILFHRLLIQPDRWLVVRAKKRFVLHLFGLN